MNNVVKSGILVGKGVGVPWVRSGLLGS